MTSKVVIVWSKASFEKLWAATKLAAEAGQEHFSVDLGRTQGRHTFTTEVAIGVCRRLHDQFSKPEKVYPENREGEEP